MRRVVPALAALAAVAVLAAALLWPAGEAATGESSARSTRQAGFGDRDGDGVLGRSPGEPLIDRTDLAPASSIGRPLATLAQVTDAHVRDEESPARAFFLDRLGEPFTSTFRPQEALSAQTLAAAVGSVNRLRPDAVLETGDLADNAQGNEMDQALAVLAGGEVRPDSGARGYDGPQSAGRADPFLYRPDLDAPRHPGLLDEAQRPFRSPGLRAPWYPVVGNHDLLVQGEAAPSPRLRALALGSRTLVEPKRGLRVPRDSGAFNPAVVDRVLANGLPGRTTATPADPTRRLLSSGEALGRLRRSSGHGGGGARMDYAFSAGRALRVIVLDIVNRAGGSKGVVSPGQLDWLRRELGRAGDRWVMVVSHQPLKSARGGAGVLAALDLDPRVVAAVSGHTHSNSIRPRRSRAGGYWLIGTASLTDYPQQVRALRLVRTDGGVALETWMIDTAPRRLADTARQLAFLDAQGGRPQGNGGTREDRNARLFKGLRAADPARPRP